MARKWIVPFLIVVLFLGAVSNGLLYIRLTNIVRDDEILIARLRADLVSANERITSLMETTDNLTGNVSGLSGSVGNLQTGVQSLTGNVSAISGLVGTLQQDLKIFSSDLAADFTNAAEKVKPAVVVINVRTVTAVLPGRTVTQTSSGSGWIINGDGLIVTNNHVIADATSIEITLADGRTFPSLAVQTDATSDLAVVKINARNLPSLKTGDSDKLQVGQPVAAVGNAVGRGLNMTGGWVSRVNNSIVFSDGRSFSGLIGTDAAINPGNSGGPLINTSGEVVGITNAKLVRAGVEGIGYAISINNALKIINNLIARF